MKNLIASFVSYVCIIVFVFVGVSFINMFVQKRNAEIFHDKFIYEVESSDFSNVVINNAISSAATNGYTLRINPVTIVEDKRLYEVEMDYSLSIPLLSVEKDGTIKGYAR